MNGRLDQCRVCRPVLNASLKSNLSQAKCTFESTCQTKELQLFVFNKDMVQLSVRSELQAEATFVFITILPGAGTKDTTCLAATPQKTAGVDLRQIYFSGQLAHCR